MINKAAILGKKMGMFDKLVNDSCGIEAPRVTVKKSDIIIRFMMALNIGVLSISWIDWWVIAERLV